MCVSVRGAVRIGIGLSLRTKHMCKDDQLGNGSSFGVMSLWREVWLNYSSAWCTPNIWILQSLDSSDSVYLSCHFTFKDSIVVYNTHPLGIAIRLLFATTSSLYSINIIKVINNVLKKELLLNNRCIYIRIIIILIQIIGII